MVAEIWAYSIVDQLVAIKHNDYRAGRNDLSCLLQS